MYTGMPSMIFGAWQKEGTGMETTSHTSEQPSLQTRASTCTPAGILGFSMKANTPPKVDRYSVLIDKVIPGTSASLAGQVAIGDEILEISGQEVKYLWHDSPNSEELVRRLQVIFWKTIH